MKRIIIESKVHGTHEVLLDDEDYEWASKYNWFVNKQGSPTYKGPDKFYIVRSVSRDPDPVSGRKQRNLRLHREIMKTPKGMHTDHINGDTLDNRKENLRVCTPAQNSQNRAQSTTNTTGYKGVARSSRHGKPWQGRIIHEGKYIHLGMFIMPEEAARAYDKKAVELWGEFATLNFPEEYNVK